jgi:hypothetical protein
VVLQAALGNGLVFDPFFLQQDNALVVAAVVGKPLEGLIFARTEWPQCIAPRSRCRRHRKWSGTGQFDR